MGICSICYVLSIFELFDSVISPLPSPSQKRRSKFKHIFDDKQSERNRCKNLSSCSLSFVCLFVVYVPSIDQWLIVTEGTTLFASIFFLACQFFHVVFLFECVEERKIQSYLLPNFFSPRCVETCRSSSVYDIRTECFNAPVFSPIFSDFKYFLYPTRQPQIELIKLWSLALFQVGTLSSPSPFFFPVRFLSSLSKVSVDWTKSLNLSVRRTIILEEEHSVEFLNLKLTALNQNQNFCIAR